MKSKWCVATVFLALVVPCLSHAQQAAAPFLTGSCVADTNADLGEFVENPEQAPSIRRDTYIAPFPDTLHRAGYEGKVVVAFIVDRDGHVRNGRVTVLSSTDPVLSRWACAAVPKMRLEPARDHGRKVASQAVL